MTAPRTDEEFANDTANDNESDDSSDTHAEHEDSRPIPKRTSARPRRTPAAALFASVVALALLGLGVMAVHDLAVRQGWAAGSEWIDDALARLDGLTPSATVVTLSVVCALAGVLLVVVALHPGRTAHVPVGDDLLDAWLAPSAIAAMAREAADRSPGVLGAELVRVSRRSVAIAISTHRTPAAVSADAHEAARQAIGDWTRTRIRITVKEVPR